MYVQTAHIDEVVDVLLDFVFNKRTKVSHFQICEPQTYEMRVIAFYSDSAIAVSPAGPTMVGAMDSENIWLF